MEHSWNIYGIFPLFQKFFIVEKCFLFVFWGIILLKGSLHKEKSGSIMNYITKNSLVLLWHHCKTPYFGKMLKGWLTVFFLGLIVFMGCSLACVHACFFLKTHYFSHNLPLFHTSLSLLWQTPRFISWFYEAPPSEIRDGLRLVSWLSVLWLAKPPLLHIWTSRPSPQWHVLRLNCKQWRCL